MVAYDIVSKLSAVHEPIPLVCMHAGRLWRKAIRECRVRCRHNLLSTHRA